MLEMLLDSMSAAWHCHVKSQQRMTFFFNRITVILTKPPWFSPSFQLPRQLDFEL